MADPNVYALSVQLSLDSSDAFASMQAFSDEAMQMEDQFAKAGLAGSKTINDQVELFADIHKALKAKNLLHDEQIELLEEDVHLVEEATKESEKLAPAFDMTSISIKGVLSGLWSMLEGLRKATEITEDFKNANYRAYGGIEQLTIGANQLSTQYGVMSKEARAAYQSLADIRTPRDEIDKLTGAVARSARETGVGVKTLATYVRMMRATGTTGDEATGNLEKMTEAMRKNGLTQEDMNRVMGDTAVSAGTLNMVFGEGAAADFTHLKAQFDGVAKSMGLASDAGSQMFNEMMNNQTAMIKMQGTSGVIIDSVESMGLAFAKSAQTIGPQIANLNATIAAGGPGAASATIQAKALAKGYGYASADAMFMSHKLNEQAAAMGMTIKTTEDLNKVMAVMQSQAQSNESAHDSFHRQMNILKDQFHKVFSTVMLLIGQALIPLMKLILFIIKPIVWLIGVISNMISWVMNLTSGLGVLGDAIQIIVGGLVAFGIYLLATGTAAVWAATAIGGAMIWLGGIVSTAMAWMVGVIGAAIASVGSMVYGLMMSLAGAIAAFGAVIAPVAVPIMQFAAALFLAGAGAYMLAQAVKIVAEVGWAAIPAIIGITAAILVLGLVLIFLGSLAQGPVAVGMLVVAATLLIVAGAAWLLAQALMIGAKAFALFAESMEKLTIGKMFAVGLAVLFMAGMLYIAGPLLLTAAMTFVPAAIGIGIGLYLLGIGLTKLAAGLEASKGLALTLVYMSLALMVAAPMLYIAAAGFVPVAFLIGVGAILLGWGLKALAAGLEASKGLALQLVYMSLALLVASPILYVAAAGFVPAAFLIGVGAILLGWGLKTLGEGLKASEGMALQLVYMSLALMVAAPMLYIAALFFTPAAISVAIGAIILGFGLKLLAWGAKEMEGVDLIAIAWQLMGASGMLYIAAMFFTPAAYALGIGALFLGAGLKLLGIGAKEMEGVDLISVANQLMMAAVPLLLAAIPLYYAGKFLLPAAVVLWIAALFIGMIGEGLIKGAQNLATSGRLLFDAGLDMLFAGPALFIGSLYLITAAVILGVAGVVLFFASGFLVVGAIALYFGVKTLIWAIGDFVKQSDNIIKMAKGLDLLGKAMTILGKIEMKQIASEIEDALAGVDKLGDLADTLHSVAAKFKTAASALKQPVNTIAEIFNKLNSALDGFHRNVQNIGSDIDKLTTAVENHADLMENAADRVNVAVGAKVAPAMSEAERVGINDAVRAETIQQVQVAVTTEGEEPGIAEGQVVLLAMMRDQLADLNDNVRKISDSSAADDIYELCARYMPSMAGKKEGLSSELNEYMS